MSSRPGGAGLSYQLLGKLRQESRTSKACLGSLVKTTASKEIKSEKGGLGIDFSVYIQQSISRVLDLNPQYLEKKKKQR